MAVDPCSTSPAPNRRVLTSATTVSVDHLRESDRFAFWKEQWCQGTVGVAGELDHSAGRDFRARATCCTSDHVIRLRCQTSPFRVSRGPREIAQRGWENSIWLYQELSEGNLFEHAGHEFVTSRGDLLLMDPTIPFTNEPRNAVGRPASRPFFPNDFYPM